MIRIAHAIRCVCLAGAFAPLATVIQASAQSPVLAKCTEALYRGDYKAAVQIAKHHLRSVPGDASVRIILARAELAQGEFQPAFEELRKAHATEPRNIDALYYIALVAREASRLQYQKLAERAPDSDRVHQLLGEAALAANNPNLAEEEFKKALEVNPRSIEVATELGDLKRSQSRFDEAIAYYTQATDVGPLDYDTAYGLGASYTYKQDYALAIEWLRKAAVLAPESSAGRFALGNALFQSGDLEAAIRELKASLQLEPRLKQAYFLLGRAYSKLGRKEEATAALKKLDELSRAEVPGHEKGTASTIDTQSDQR